MRVTKSWIIANSTPRGGWTHAQLLSIGIPVPPETGWQDRAEGTCITEEAARAFEELGRIGRRPKHDRQTQLCLQSALSLPKL